MGTALFILGYVILMSFTYMWPFAFAGEVGLSLTLDEASLAVFWSMLVNYALLMLIAYFRGKKVGKKYLPMLTLTAGVIDILLPFIPFIPTILNVVVLVLGVIEDGDKKAALSRRPPKRKKK